MRFVVQPPRVLPAVDLPAAAAAGQVEDRGVFVYPDHRRTRRARRGPPDKLGGPGPELVEMRQDAQPRQHAKPGLRLAVRSPDRGHPVGQGDRSRRASRQRRAGPPGGFDGRPDARPAQGPREVERVSAGQVDQAGAGHQGGQIFGLGFGPVPDDHGNLIYPEPLGLGRAQIEPVLQALPPLGRRRRRDLDVPARASLDQQALDVRHDRQVLATSHQRQRPRPRPGSGVTMNPQDAWPHRSLGVWALALRLARLLRSGSRSPHLVRFISNLYFDEGGQLRPGPGGRRSARPRGRR